MAISKHTSRIPSQRYGGRWSKRGQFLNREVVNVHAHQFAAVGCLNVHEQPIPDNQWWVAQRAGQRERLGDNSGSVYLPERALFISHPIPFRRGGNTVTPS